LFNGDCHGKTLLKSSINPLFKTRFGKFYLLSHQLPRWETFQLVVSSEPFHANGVEVARCDLNSFLGFLSMMVARWATAAGENHRSLADF
jgi:hypothetical protein